ncbi:hypothetical protein KY362_05760 [Candidatus Woesearchaeota archaeon]|nr:hypothetical protein [Candidatus Woesearchaeota archaeon]
MPENIRQRILNKLEVTQSNPLHFFMRLVDRKDYRLRIGKYRITADIDLGRKVIEVTLIELRDKAYD